jgi:hypothetical protein
MKRKVNQNKADRVSKGESIRERIKELKQGELHHESDKQASSVSNTSSPGNESPREFIARRMRELDRKKAKK